MRGFLWKIYTYTFLDQFILIYPVYSLFFQDNGLSPFQIASLFAIWSVVKIIFEVPTGVLADKYSRKNLLIAAQLIKGLGYLSWLVGHNYLSFALGFVLWGFAGTLVSGTFEAFVYDELKSYQKESLYGRIVGKINGTRSVGITLAVGLGGVLAQLGYGFAFIPSIFVPLLAAGVVMSIGSVRSARSTGERQYWRILKAALHEAYVNPLLLRLMSYMAIVFGVASASDEFWALLFNDWSISLTVIGILFAVANGIAALGSYTAHWWQLGEKATYGFVIVGSIFILFLAMVQSSLAIALSFIVVYTTYVARTKLETRLQHTISSHQRATVSSLNSLVLELVAIGFYLGVGFLATTYGIVSFLWLFGGVTIVFSLLYLFTKATKKTAFSLSVTS